MVYLTRGEAAPKASIAEAEQRGAVTDEGLALLSGQTAMFQMSAPHR